MEVFPLLAVGSYLLGSVPTAFIATKAVKGVDLRRFGSGNVGAANAAVAISRKAAVPIGLLDLFKGALPVLVGKGLGLTLGQQVVVGLCVVVGHNWSIYLRFTGGRGVVTSMGVLSALAPWQLLASVVIAVGGILLFKGVGFWVGVALLTTPLWALAFRERLEVVLLCAGLVGLVACKRLLANDIRPVLNSRGWKVLLYRILYDRDVAPGEPWNRRDSLA